MSSIIIEKIFLPGIRIIVGVGIAVVKKTWFLPSYTQEGKTQVKQVIHK
jgi:hypothetical protein